MSSTPQAPPRPVEPRPPTTPGLAAWWLVAAIGLAGFVLIGLYHVRAGGLVLAAGAVVAALLRLVLPQSRAGGLVIRTRTIDIAMYLAVAGVVGGATLLLRL